MTINIKKVKTVERILEFRRIKRPKFIDTLVFPADTLTTLDLEQISDLHAKYTLLYAYANQGLSDSNVTTLRLHGQRGRRENEMFRLNPAMNTLDKWRRDAKVREDIMIEEINSRLHQENMVKIQLEMLLMNYEKFIAALSREMSRRSYERTAIGI